MWFAEKSFTSAGSGFLRRAAKAYFNALQSLFRLKLFLKELTEFQCIFAKNII